MIFAAEGGFEEGFDLVHVALRFDQAEVKIAGSVGTFGGEVGEGDLGEFSIIRSEVGCVVCIVWGVDVVGVINEGNFLLEIIPSGRGIGVGRR